jgi:4-hydroxy-tetrahydrodipicolinate synthase
MAEGRLEEEVKAEGIIAALITPYDEQDTVDTKELRRLVNHLIERGVHGLFVVSNAGEFYALSDYEKELILNVVVEEADGRVPIYFGSGAITTRDAVRLTKMAAENGADAVSVITPYFIRFSEGELYDHYKAISEAADVPVLVYSNPSLTGISVSAKLMTKLVQIENLIGIKDSSGDLALTQEYIAVSPKLSVLAGRDGLILSTLIHGGTGAISSTANVAPSLAVEIYEAFRSGDLEGAAAAQNKLATLRQAFRLGTFPSVLKEALIQQGFEVGPPRKPARPLTLENRSRLRDVLASLELL